MSVRVLSEGSFDILRHCCASVVRKASRCTVPASFLFASFRMSSSREKKSQEGNKSSPECKYNQHLPLDVPQEVQ